MKGMIDCVQYKSTTRRDDDPPRSPSARCSWWTSAGFLSPLASPPASTLYRPTACPQNNVPTRLASCQSISLYNRWHDVLLSDGWLMWIPQLRCTVNCLQIMQYSDPSQGWHSVVPGLYLIPIWHRKNRNLFLLTEAGSRVSGPGPAVSSSSTCSALLPLNRNDVDESKDLLGLQYDFLHGL